LNHIGRAVDARRRLAIRASQIGEVPIMAEPSIADNTIALSPAAAAAALGLSKRTIQPPNRSGHP
jgi:hypothetical protein